MIMLLSMIIAHTEESERERKRERERERERERMAHEKIKSAYNTCIIIIFYLHFPYT